MALDPFYVFAVFVEIALAGYVVWLLVKVASWFRNEKRGLSGDVKWWAKSVLDQNAPNRPTEEYIAGYRAQKLDVRGKKTKVRKTTAIRMAAITVAFVVVWMQMSGMIHIENLLSSPPPAPTYIVIRPLWTYLYWNLTSCQNHIVTEVYGIVNNNFMDLYLDEPWNPPNVTARIWELGLVASACDAQYFHLSSYKVING